MYRQKTLWEGRTYTCALNYTVVGSGAVQVWTGQFIEFTYMYMCSYWSTVNINKLQNPWMTYLTIILRNRAEYHLILSRRGRRPSWLNQGIFRKIEQDNCFIIQQIPINYHFQNEKNYGSMMKTLKASNT